MAKQTRIYDLANDEIRELDADEDSDVDERGIADPREFLRRVGVFEDALALLDEMQRAA